jgi:hypothetical protein
MAVRLTDYDPSRFFFEDCVNTWFMLQDITMRELGTVPGFVFVVDMKGASMGHITKVSLATLKKYYMYIQVGICRYRFTFRQYITVVLQIQ